MVNSCELYHPVNSIHNPCTRYREIELPAARLDMIWQVLKGIGRFPMARVGVKADNWQALTQGEFKVVVKPNVSGFSRGSHFPITSYFELFKAIVLVKIWWPSSVIETYLQGKNYRIVLVKEGIMSVIRRYPPFVVGDGRASIGELIDRENKTRERMHLTPVIHPIRKNNGIARFLKKQHLSFSSVPGKGERITLFNRISLAPGGVIETLDLKQVHEKNKRLFEKVLPLFKANILGVDAIFEKGIDQPYTDQRVIFLEVNSRPYLKMHDYPRFGVKQDLRWFYDGLKRLAIQQKDIF